jgi:methyltransferase-like protein/ubiquinone/menaquinone biosynthesis C-methylase UbiE
MDTVTSYELMPYFGAPFAQTHPDRLATMATIFGMNPSPIANCRVLEIGCGDGGNILPMALSLPGATFVGIDLSVPAIEKANDITRTLGISNIEFHAADLMRPPADLGTFDYIVAHGVYSWVPEAIGEKLVALAGQMLRPQGVAYISYNAYPGGHMRAMLREMMMYRIRGMTDPATILAAARDLLEFIGSAGGPKDEYITLVRKETEALATRPDYGFFHDELEENNHQVYFHEFIDLARRYGLQYLSEANYFDMREDTLGPETAERLRNYSDDPIVREQYLDFARCRRFRQTLLCHAHIKLERPVSHERMRGLYFASPARVVSTEGDIQEFHGPHESKVKTAHPLVRAILHRLIAKWPGVIHFDELIEDELAREAACSILHALFAAGLVEARLAPPRMELTPGERPVASALARLHASRGTHITTLRHTTIQTSGALEKKLIELLDGTRNREDLLTELIPLLETEKTREELALELNQSLVTLGRLCLLIS